jgi:hypothetical protein
MEHLYRVALRATYVWYQSLEIAWPYIGAAFVLSLWLAWLLRRTEVCRWLLLSSFALIIYQPDSISRCRISPAASWVSPIS